MSPRSRTPLLIGERLNAQGSRTVRRLLMARDVDALVDIGRAQLAAGADALDVHVGLPGVAGEAERMATLVERLAAHLTAPISLDSTDPAVFARALPYVPRRAMLNSVSLARGRATIDAVVPLAREYEAAIVALTIDEAGMAYTAARKLEIACRLHEIIVRELGMPDDRVMIDPLVFPLVARGDVSKASAIETLDGIRLIKEALSETPIVVGISNVSFGLAPAARRLLNSALLYHGVQAGLAAAIVDPLDAHLYSDLTDDARRRTDAVLFNRAPAATLLVAGR